MAGWSSCAESEEAGMQKAVCFTICEVVVVMPTMVSRMSGGGPEVRMEVMRVWIDVRRELVRASRNVWEEVG